MVNGQTANRQAAFTNMTPKEEFADKGMAFIPILTKPIPILRILIQEPPKPMARLHTI